MRLKIIGDEMIRNVSKSESCMVSKLPSTFKNSNQRQAARDTSQSVSSVVHDDAVKELTLPRSGSRQPYYARFDSFPSLVESHILATMHD